MTVTNPSGQHGETDPPSGAAIDHELVQQRLAEFRRDLYRGHGPGISEQQRRRHTRERPTVAGVPTAASREAIHLRTLRIRGQHAELNRETQWANAQFPHPDPQPADPLQPQRVYPMIGVSGVIDQ